MFCGVVWFLCLGFARVFVVLCAFVGLHKKQSLPYLSQILVILGESEISQQ